MLSVPHYDPRSPENLANPFANYAAMRGGCPVAHCADPIAPFWVMFRYQDIRTAQMDANIWTSRYGSSPVFQKSIGFFADGPEHHAFRNIFKERLSPRGLARIQPAVQRIAEDQLEQMLAKGPHIDLHDDFALPLPVRIISLLLGIPSDDYPVLKTWSDDLIDHGFGQNNEAFLKTYEGVCTFFDAYLDQRYADLEKAGISAPTPTHIGSILPDDWISDAICADYMGRKLTRAEQRIALMGLLVGGNETTTSLITNVMWRLLEVPARWESVKADADHLIPVAIEESLRFDSPTLGMFRTSLCPVQLHGAEIPAKQKLMLAYGAANHDPEIFSKPDEFRLDRSMEELQKHMAFGMGKHSCPGAPLSRMEAKIALELIVKRAPDIALNGPTARNVGFNFWGRRKLPLKIEHRQRDFGESF